MTRITVNSLYAQFSVPAVGLCAIAMVVALAGCEAGGHITVTSDYGPGIKFSGLGTAYSWLPETEVHSPGAKEMQELIRSSADNHLAKKGFALSSAGTVDFLLGYRVAKREKTDANAAPHGEVFEEGTLVLDVLETAASPESGGAHRLIWRGIARARILDSDPPKLRQERMESAMRELMKKFPAKA